MTLIFFISPDCDVLYLPNSEVMLCDINTVCKSLPGTQNEDKIPCHHCCTELCAEHFCQTHLNTDSPLITEDGNWRKWIKDTRLLTGESIVQHAAIGGVIHTRCQLGDRWLSASKQRLPCSSPFSIQAICFTVVKIKWDVLQQSFTAS